MNGRKAGTFVQCTNCNKLTEKHLARLHRRRKVCPRCYFLLGGDD